MKQATKDNLVAYTIIALLAFTLSYVMIVAMDETAEYNQAQESSYINR